MNVRIPEISHKHRILLRKRSPPFIPMKQHCTLKIHEDLRNITTRFGKHFDNIKVLRKKLEEAMKVTDDFGRDARSIMRTLENIKDPEQVEKAIKEDVHKIKVLNK